MCEIRRVESNVVCTSLYLEDYLFFGGTQSNRFSAPPSIYFPEQLMNSALYVKNTAFAVSYLAGKSLLWNIPKYDCSVFT